MYYFTNPNEITKQNRFLREFTVVKMMVVAFLASDLVEQGFNTVLFTLSPKRRNHLEISSIGKLRLLLTQQCFIQDLHSRGAIWDM